MPTTDGFTNAYALEVISRAKAAQHRAETLCVSGFASYEPKCLGEVLGRVFAYLSDVAVVVCKRYSRLDAVVELHDHLKRIDSHVKLAYSFLRYVDASRIESLPWSIIPSFKAAVSKLFGKEAIVLVPQWNYNYSIELANLFNVLSSSLREYDDYLPINDILKPLSPAFRVIFFPVLERKNILLHTLLGHEIGHILAEGFLTPEIETKFSQSIESQLVEISLKQEEQFHIRFRQKPSLASIWRREAIAQSRLRAVKIWKRALTEMISDCVCAYLFGPAALFAAVGYAEQEALDNMPDESTNFYPPWRTRIRFIYETIEHMKLGFFPVAPPPMHDSPASDEDLPYFRHSGPDGARRIQSRLDEIIQLVGDESDRQQAGTDVIVALAYGELDQYLADARDFVACRVEQAGLALPTATQLYPALSELVERLHHRIPPNALEHDFDKRRPSTLVEIINATWFYRICSPRSTLTSDGEFNEAAHSWRNDTNNLTLKAIELAELERVYVMRT